jgi:hypothetical protein
LAIAIAVPLSAQKPSAPAISAMINNLGTKLISRASTLALRLVLSPASKNVNAQLSMTVSFLERVITPFRMKQRRPRKGNLHANLFLLILRCAEIRLADPEVEGKARV